MSDPSPPPPKPSPGFVWLRILAWTLPGISAPAFVFVWGFGSYMYSASETLITIGAIAALGSLMVGAGIFDSLLHLTRTRGGGNFSRGAVAGQTCAFVGAQLFIVPLLSVSIITACNVVI